MAINVEPQPGSEDAIDHSHANAQAVKESVLQDKVAEDVRNQRDGRKWSDFHEAGEDDGLTAIYTETCPGHEGRHDRGQAEEQIESNVEEHVIHKGMVVDERRRRQ